MICGATSFTLLLNLISVDGLSYITLNMTEPKTPEQVVLLVLK